MKELRELIVLQARLSEFLAQQDDATLQALIQGTAQLAVVHSDGAREDTPAAPPASTNLAVRPSSDPLQAARDLPVLPSQHERRLYLNAAGLPATGLRRVAKLLGLTQYSSLKKAELLDLLAGTGKSPSDLRDNSTAERQQAPEVEHPSDARPDPQATAIASHLREIETEEEGATYLRAQRLSREDLLAVAAELQLTRVERLKPTELEKRVIKQAIGARRKFAGLRTW
ncbi:hypothetical protein [Amycolatopsis sp. 195334CR]|uniref:hypothetical protein n=1 Tax=Amycolatopsis sp. 195334CR TaxID=2814588 RepID=UPI001A90C8A3|nr:hypothetical protein [Amycolatopsis sp. 195334CR]MBN6034710.1 hypothetical protein [Amycolatopsis sp. 195334CR]